MKFDPVKTAVFDGVLRSYIDENPGLSDRWILEQDLYTAPGRRALLQALAPPPGGTLLDAGCAFGVIGLDLAGHAAFTVLGLDSDPEKIEVGGEIEKLLRSQGHFAAGSTVSLDTGTLATLPYDSGSVDFTIANFVYQHLADPTAVTAELYRVIKPGGTLCVVDADDGISLVYPEPTEAYSRLSDAFARRQERAGGDRQVGRKLARYLDLGGFDVASTLMLPVAEYRATGPSDPGQRFLVERLREARDDIVSGSLMTAEDFDDCLAQLDGEYDTVQFRTNAQIVAVGRKPG